MSQPSTPLLIEILSSLHETLLAEFKALGQLDFASVENLSAQKQRSASMLSGIDAAALTFTSDQREQLSSLSREIARQSQINARIASEMLARSTQKLQIIAQLSANSYGSDGKPLTPEPRGGLFSSKT